MTARHVIGGLILAALLGFPASAAGKGGGPVQSLAAQQCKQERADLGKKGFRRKYGAKHTMRNCIKRTRPRVTSTLAPATQQCQAELTEEGVAEFLDDYLDDVGSVDDAMAECVAETVDELLNPDDYADDDETDDE